MNTHKHPKSMIKKLSTFSLVLILLNSCNQTEEVSLIKKIAKTPNAELASMTFFELNILKNAVFSLQGYKYAEDRKWLYNYFYLYSEPQKENLEWNLNLNYAPPGSNEFKFTDDMKKAVANVRIAIFQKIRSIGDINKLDELIDEEFENHDSYIFGRKISYGYIFRESIRREVHGYNRIVNIIDEKSAFDASELLGVYIGSVILLKQVIEAQNGKIHKGVLGWEISQLIGITPKKKNYNPDEIPDLEKQKLKIIDKVIERIKKSGIGDIPPELNKQNLKMDEEEVPDDYYYDSENYDESAYGAAC